MEEEKKQKALLLAILSFSVVNFALLMYLVVFSGGYFGLREKISQMMDYKSEQVDVSDTGSPEAQRLPENTDKNAQAPASNTAVQPPAGGGTAAGKCGDGTCDSAEKANSSLCPKDCGGSAAPAVQPNGTIQENQKKCGDGVCDSIEKERGLCTVDCK